MTFLSDIETELSVVQRSFEDVEDSVSNAGLGLSAVDSVAKKLEGSLKGSNSAIGKSAQGLSLLTGAASKSAQAISTIAGEAVKIAIIARVAEEGRKALRSLDGVSNTLDFEQAITGADTLNKSLKQVEDTGRGLSSVIGVSLDNIFDPQKVNSWAKDSVAAYAQVEQAAYRLSTITVGAGERSIDALDGNIKSMRKLQAATGDVVSSVELLNAQYDIASGGFTSTQDNLNVGEASINLSQAGFGDIGGSTSGIVKTLRALGEESSMAEKRAAQLFETTKVGLLTLDQLNSNIGPLAVQAKQLGVEFSEVTAAVAGLTTQGISADEAATRLSSLFSDIAAGSSEANTFLAQFRDEAGKPIQINATALQEKGLAGVLDDLEAATGGRIENIQKVFSNQTSQEGLALLGSLGGDQLRQDTQRIDSVDGTDLGEEARNRTRTVSGAFERGQNLAQKSVEDFGQGFAPKVLEDALKANKELEKFATSGAESLGKLSGSLTGAIEKAKAIGGFLVKAFTITAPLFLFNNIIQLAAKLGKKLLSLRKEGESPFQSIQRVAKESIDKILAYIIKAVDRSKAKVAEIREEVQKPIEVKVETKKTKENTSKPNTSQEPRNNVRPFKKESNTSKNPKVTVETDTKQVDKAESKVRRFRRLAEQKIRAAKVKFDVTTSNATGRLSGIRTSASKAKDVLSSLGKVGGGAAKEGIGVLAKTAGQSAKLLAGGALAAGAAGVAFAVLSGWATTLGAALNKKALPGMQNLREALLAVEGVEGLDKIVDELDPISGSVETSSFFLNSLNESLARGTKLWNDFTGASTRASFVLEKIKEAQLENSDSLNARFTEIEADDNSIGAISEEAQRAEEKIKLGISLDESDKRALESDIANARKQADLKVTLAEQVVVEGEGKLSEENLATAKAELEAAKKAAAIDKERLDSALKRALVADTIQNFNNINTAVPIQIAVDSTQTRAIQAQIDDIGARFKDGLSGALDNPEALGNLQSGVVSTLSSIQTKVELNPGAAAKLNQELRDAIPDFDKLIASNAQIRKLASELNRAITDAIVQESQTTEQSNTAVLSQAETSGSDATAISLAKYAEQVKSINTQVNALNEELAKPETSLSRQLEIVAQIEQLEAQRLANSVDAAIKQELGLRKQTLTLNEQLLDVDKARLSLFNEESRFGSLAITQAEARLTAAQNELEVRKEANSLESRENEIKKEVTLAGLQSRADRQQGQANALAGGLDTSDPEATKEELKRNVDEEINKKSSTADRTISEISSNTIEKATELRDGPAKFSEEEQLKVAQAIKDSLPPDLTGQITKNVLANQAGQDVSNTSSGELKSLDGIAKTLFNNEGQLNNQEGLQKFLSEGFDSGVVGDAAEVGKTVTAAALAVLPTGLLLDAGKGEAFNPISGTSDFKTILDSVSGKQGASNSRAEATAVLSEASLSKLQEANSLEAQGKEQIKEVEKNQALFEETQLAGLEESLNRVSTGLNEASNTQEIIGGDASNSQGIDTQNSPEPSEGITAQEDLAAAQTASDVSDKFGALAEEIEVLNAQIDAEFAAREKLIKQSELVAKSLSDIAGNSAAFGNTVAGAALELQSLETRDVAGQLDTEAEKEIQKIDAKVQKLSEDAVAAEEAVRNARNNGASDAQVEALEAQAKDSRELADSAKAEGEDDKLFVKEQVAREKVSSALELNIATIEAEFASRERIIAINEKLSKSISDIAGNNTFFADSVAGASLRLQALEAQDVAGKLETEAEKEIEVIKARSEALDGLAKASEQSVEAARQSGADPEKIKELEEAAAKARNTANKGQEEADSDIAFTKENLARQKIAAALDISAASIEAEFASRERIVEINDKLSSSFDSLASTAGSLFKSSSFGASLSSIGAELGGQAEESKINTEVEKQTKILAERRNALEQLLQAEKNGANDPERVAEIEKTIEDNNQQEAVEKEQLRQNAILSKLNNGLTVFSAKVNEVTDTLGKQADITKEVIDFEQRRKDLAAETNQSGTGLQSSIFGFLGDNNPFAEALQGRLDFQQAGDNADLQKSQNVTEAKKEIIDLSLQKAQLELEQRGFENALGQTALLADLVNVTQGLPAQYGESVNIDDRLKEFPELIAKSQALTSQRSGLLDEQLAFIPQELQQRNENVDRDRIAQQLGGLNAASGANFDLIRQSLEEAFQSSSAFQRQDLEVGSLGDSVFKEQLQQLNNITRQSSFDFDVANIQALTSSPGAGGPAANSGNTSINAPINLSVSVTGDGANATALQNAVLQQANVQINRGLKELSNRVDAATR